MATAFDNSHKHATAHIKEADRLNSRTEIDYQQAQFIANQLTQALAHFNKMLGMLEATNQDYLK